VPGALAGIANVIARDGANIVSLDQTARDGAFHTFLLDVEVHDLEHLMRLIAALRSTDLVSSAERI
jgi:(p)ppGpp synthase/HD superfamily hydrolase